MGPYRSGTERRVLEIQPEPIQTIVLGSGLAIFLVLGLFLLLGLLAEDGATGGVVARVFGGAFLAIGLLVAGLAWKRTRTTVLFEVEGPRLKLTWQYRGATTRVLELPREDVVDVAIGHAPEAGDVRRWITIGTRHGDIALSHGWTGAREAIAAERDKIGHFLDAPPRSP